LAKSQGQNFDLKDRIIRQLTPQLSQPPSSAFPQFKLLYSLKEEENEKIKTAHPLAAFLFFFNGHVKHTLFR